MYIFVTRKKSFEILMTATLCASKDLQILPYPPEKLELLVSLLLHC